MGTFDFWVEQLLQYNVCVELAKACLKPQTDPGAENHLTTSLS